MYSAREYAIRLETVFNSENITADDFIRDFQGSLEIGFGYLAARGKVSSQNVSGYLDNFSDIESLNDIQKDEFKGSQIEGLIQLIKDLSNQKCIE